MEVCPNCSDRILDPDLPCPTCGKIPNELPAVKMKNRIRNFYWGMQAFSGYFVVIAVLILILLAIYLRPTAEDAARARKKEQISLETALKEIGGQDVSSLMSNLDSRDRVLISVSLLRLRDLAASGEDSARNKLIGTLGHKDPDVRYMAIPVLQELLPQKEFIDTIGEVMLRDDSYYVRRRALHTIGNINSPDVIPYLIEGLKFKYPTRYEVKVFLVRLTGVDMDDEYELWKRWWAQNRERFSLWDDR